MDDEKIAVFVKDRNCITSSDAADTVTVFEKKYGGWTISEQHYVDLQPEDGLSQARGRIRGLIKALGGCRIAAGTGMTGVVYRELDLAGFSIFEIDSADASVLDGILDDAKAGSEEGESDMPSEPVETGTAGVYALDLVRLQQVHPEVTSKQAMKKFLETTPFYELRLRCAHIPPWLENGPYEIQTEKTCSGDTDAVIRKKQNQGGRA